MSSSVDLYDSHYDRLNDDVYRAIRAETFGLDLGQESWITAEECDRFCRWLEIRRGHRVLEVACGSGGVAARVAETTGASVVGVDINDFAVKAARKRTTTVEFLAADADQPLPFPDGSFDRLICNDAINHFRDRPHVFREWRRLLRPGGRCLFTDPVVVTGLISNAELAARSSIGFFVFSAPGVNDAHLQAAGFRVARCEDVTEAVASTSRKWHQARESRRAALEKLEGAAGCADLQRFLAAVCALATERRLSRFAFVAECSAPT